MGFVHDRAPLYFPGSGRLVPDASLWRELAGRALSLLSLDWTLVTQGALPCPAPRRMFEDHKMAGYGADLERAYRECRA